MTARYAVVFLFVLTAGCGPIGSEAHIARAQRALRQAEMDDGAHKAPYPYAAAQAYLTQARIAYGYARFGDAQDLADLARGLADQAQAAPALAPGACPKAVF